MYRRVLLVTLLSLIFAGATVAQDDNSKAVPFMYGLTPLCWEPPCDLTQVQVDITPPEKTPDKYRVSWAINGRWRSWRKPNTKKYGNAFIDGDSYRYKIRGIRIPYGKTLHIRVRAIYKGEKNGPWMCCLEAGYGDD